MCTAMLCVIRWHDEQQKMCHLKEFLGLSIERNAITLIQSMFYSNEDSGTLHTQMYHSVEFERA